MFASANTSSNEAELRLIDENNVRCGRIIRVLETTAFMWKIDEFSESFDEHFDGILSSPTFAIGNDGAWDICLYPNGDESASGDYMSLFLRHERRDDEEVEATLDFHVLNAQLQKVNRMTCSTPNWGFSDFIRKQELLDSREGLLPEGSLTIVCEISPTERDPINRLTVATDFEYLLESGKYSDLTLEAGGSEFKVHKNILAARSSIFSEMFDKKPRQERLSIPGVSCTVMRQILRFIYTEKVDDLSDLAQEILVAAHSYKIDELKLICQKALAECFTVFNACNLYALAYEHDAKWLKRKCLNYIIVNASEIIDTDRNGYRNLTKLHPQLLEEIFCEMVRRQSG